MAKLTRNQTRVKKHLKIRKRISGTDQCPRLAVFKSNKYVYAQLIDDVKKHTIASASSREADFNLDSTKDINASAKVGELIATRAKELGVSKAVFDRAGYIYHGKVKAIADAAREHGLKF